MALLKPSPNNHKPEEESGSRKGTQEHSQKDYCKTLIRNFLQHSNCMCLPIFQERAHLGVSLSLTF